MHYTSRRKVVGQRCADLHACVPMSRFPCEFVHKDEFDVCVHMSVRLHSVAHLNVLTSNSYSLNGRLRTMLIGDASPVHAICEYEVFMHSHDYMEAYVKV